MLINLDEFQKEELQELDFWSDFARGFEKGFTKTIDLAQQAGKAANPFIHQMYGPDHQYTQYADAFGQATDIGKQFSDAAFNRQLALMQLHAEHPEMQQLDFWKDFGKGFKKGFGMVMEPASKLAPVFGGADGGSMGAIFGGINNGVQRLPFQQLHQQVPVSKSDMRLIY